ncbi:MAG: hypothetical protein IPN29_12370 [Saprospiraceae bacterium]|nr:hypothetical protein [Saprospiraceae bacterium]
MRNKLHDEIFDFMEHYRKNHPGFYYSLRKRNDEKFGKGLWFGGNDDSAVVGLYKLNGGHNKTPAICIVFNDQAVWLEIAFKGIEDKEELELYRKILEVYQDFKLTSPEHYKKKFSLDNGFNSISKFLEEFVPKVNEIIYSLGLKSAYITKENF